MPDRSSRDGETGTPVLSSQAVVDISAQSARQWFLSLKQHPERYEFETHQGFEFVEGGFGEVGAQFETREEFLFLNLRLLFELTAVCESQFRFRLVRPLSVGIWGRFDVQELGDKQAQISLEVGSDTRAGQLLLRCYPLNAPIRRQIHREVSHIKTSMERLSSS